eukprot:3942336-Pyramimonas_sp.AAC.1
MSTTTNRCMSVVLGNSSHSNSLGSSSTGTRRTQGTPGRCPACSRGIPARGEGTGTRSSVASYAEQVRELFRGRSARGEGTETRSSVARYAEQVRELFRGRSARGEGTEMRSSVASYAEQVREMFRGRSAKREVFGSTNTQLLLQHSNSPNSLILAYKMFSGVLCGSLPLLEQEDP